MVPERHNWVSMLQIECVARYKLEGEDICHIVSSQGYSSTYTSRKNGEDGTFD